MHAAKLSEIHVFLEWIPPVLKHIFEEPLSVKEIGSFNCKDEQWMLYYLSSSEETQIVFDSV